MSETVQSEIVKSVSEVGEFECHGHTDQNKGGGHGHGHSQKGNPPGNNSLRHGNKSPGAGSGSRSGSNFLPSLFNATLPSRLAIIVGLCQVAVGGAMVLTGIIAIRYQSYLFHYGTGLWAGLLSAITGLLGVMCTKNGISKPSWVCGGKKWQVHVFLLAIVFSMSSVTLLAIFSISGLLQDARTIMAVEVQSDLEEILVSKNTSGILINTVLLLLSILQILLCFSSLGITVRVMFQTKGGLLSSKGSSGSEIAIRDGLEYHARKDHLIHWLGHQRPNVIPLGLGGSSHKPYKYAPQPPAFVAVQPVLYSPRRMMPYHHSKGHMIPMQMPMPMHPQMILSPSEFAFGPPPPPTHLVPICSIHPTPVPSVIMPPKSRRTATATPVSSIASLSVAQEHHNKRQQQRKRAQAMSKITRAMIGNSSSNSSYPHQAYVTHSKAPSVISTKTERSEKNNEVEVTEVDVSRTYTGLDRSIADDYICAMNARKASSISANSAVSGPDREDEDVEEYVGGEDSETEITRM